MARDQKYTWTMTEEVGEERLRALLTDFYDRLYDDIIIGFFFTPHDKQALIEHQLDYVCAHVGAGEGKYEGRSMRRAHEHHPILSGHFDRRHQILREVLEDHDVPEHVSRAWLELDSSLRTFILNQGAMERDRRLRPDME